MEIKSMSMRNLNIRASIDKCLNWDFRFSNNCSNEDEDNGLLTTLVRKSYINHLNKSLIKNYEQWLDSIKDCDNLVCTKEDILKCGKLLEHKCMRACVITRYYQRAMDKTIKGIKKSTAKGSLFSPLSKHVFVLKTNNQCEKGTQTNISLTNCTVEPPEQSENILKIKQIKETSNIGNTQNNSNEIIPNSCTDKHDKYGNNDLEDLINILTMSQNFEEKNESDKAPSPKEIEHVDSIKHINELKELTDSGYVDEKKNRRNLDDRIQKFAILFGINEHNQTSKVQEKTYKPLVMNPQNNTNVKFFPNHDNANISFEDNTPLKLALDWKSQYVAHSCNLKCILARSNPVKKAKIQKKFEILFGTGKSFNFEISLSEAALNRKRTANLVVEALSPHYFRGKIASRNVFKSLVKKITDDILLVTNTAGIEEVTDKVNAYLENGSIISKKNIIIA